MSQSPATAFLKNIDEALVSQRKLNNQEHKKFRKLDTLLGTYNNYIKYERMQRCLPDIYFRTNKTTLGTKIDDREWCFVCMSPMEQNTIQMFSILVTVLYICGRNPKIIECLDIPGSDYYTPGTLTAVSKFVDDIIQECKTNKCPVPKSIALFKQQPTLKFRKVYLLGVNKLVKMPNPWKTL